MREPSQCSRSTAGPEPARRATDDDVVVVDKDEHQQPERHDKARHRNQPQVAIVDPHHGDHRCDAEQRPLDLRTDRLERVGIGGQVSGGEVLGESRRLGLQRADQRLGIRGPPSGDAASTFDDVERLEQGGERAVVL